MSRSAATRDPVRLFVATHDGQTARVAAAVADRLQSRGLAVVSEILRNGEPTPTVGPASLVVLLAAVRYGRHLPQARAFAAAYGGTVSPPLAVASVCLTARKPNRRSPDDNPYLKRLIARCGLRPVLGRAFGGMLDYPRYRWFDRQMIRLIMVLTGGPTDAASVIEYTDWDEVAAFADQLADIARAPA